MSRTHEQTVVTKAVAQVENVESTNPNGEFDLILSASTEDRDGEVIQSRAFEPLPDHLSMDIDHGMSVATTVGSGTPSYDDQGNLRVRGSYASTPLGQQVRTLVTEGHVRTASVAFITKTTTKSEAGKKTITKAELLNGAFTPVPSNRDAVVLSSKALTAIEQATGKSGARNSINDLGYLQTAHDAIIAAGATCGSGGKSYRPAQVKSIVGSVEALQDRVTDALEDAYGSTYGYWGWLRGVLPTPDGTAGKVVFTSSQVDPTEGDSATYQQDYLDDGAVITLTGTATEVDIHEIVAPDADADRESKSVSDPAAPKAAGSDTDTALAVDVALRAAALRANSALL